MAVPVCRERHLLVCLGLLNNIFWARRVLTRLKSLSSRKRHLERQHFCIGLRPEPQQCSRFCYSRTLIIRSTQAKPRSKSLYLRRLRFKADVAFEMNRLDRAIGEQAGITRGNHATPSTNWSWKIEENWMPSVWVWLLQSSIGPARPFRPWAHIPSDHKIYWIIAGCNTIIQL